MILGQSLRRAFLPLLSGNTPIIDDILGILGVTQMLLGTPSGLHQCPNTFNVPKLQLCQLGIVLLGQQSFNLLLHLMLSFQKLRRAAVICSNVKATITGA